MDSDTLRVYSIHLQSNRITEATNNVLNSDNFDQDKTWESILGILKRYRQHHRARSVQAKTVKEHISLSPYPVLVCGDFNDVPMSFTYEHISERLVDAYKTKGSGVGSTFNGKIFYESIIFWHTLCWRWSNLMWSGKIIQIISQWRPCILFPRSDFWLCFYTLQ